MTNILIHGSGHKATSWNETISYMEKGNEILYPELSQLLGGKEASWVNLRSSFAEYCNKIDGQFNLCGISLGGILALNYALDFPEKVKSLVIIGTPHKIKSAIFFLQAVVFKFFPKSIFKHMGFNKKDTDILRKTMKDLDFSDRLKEIKCETLIICGKKDGIAVKSAYYFAENIKGSRLKIFENVGHVVNEEIPRDLAQELNEFYRLSGINE